MTTAVQKTDALRSGRGRGSLWGDCDIYVCSNPECRSKVLVLEGPLRDPERPAAPRCVCGKALERSGTVAPVSPAWGACDVDPCQERE
jgi:hypothetical protein